MTQSPHYSLMLHGGAGRLDAFDDPTVAARHLDSLRAILERGRTLLAAGASALDTVETCAALLEDDPLFNAGRGSVLNEDGYPEMDAAIMDGTALQAGAVAGVQGIANPVRLARRVMSDSGHVLLTGEGALRFADRIGMPRCADDALITAERRAQWLQMHAQGEVGLDHDGDKHGTIGALALDLHGHLAAATSTGGTVNKRLGRVGDSPIIGAGTWADDENCAVSCTGHGEDFLRTVLAKTLADLMGLQRLDGATATRQGIDHLARRVNGRGGFILLDRDGGCHAAFTTPRMIHGWIERGGKAMYRF